MDFLLVSHLWSFFLAQSSIAFLSPWMLSPFCRVPFSYLPYSPLRVYLFPYSLILRKLHFSFPSLLLHPSGSLQHPADLICSPPFIIQGGGLWYISPINYSISHSLSVSANYHNHYYSTTSMNFSLMITWSPPSFWCFGRWIHHVFKHRLAFCASFLFSSLMHLMSISLNHPMSPSTSSISFGVSWIVLIKSVPS